MMFLLTFACAIAGVYLLRKPLLTRPFAFYLLAVAMAAIGVCADSIDMPRTVWLALFELEQKAILPLALFSIVMFTGCFERDSFVGKSFFPVRSELSIVAWILTLAHVIAYAQSYLSRIIDGSFLSGNIFAGFAVAAILLLLLFVLGITSFKLVKRNMSTEAWRFLQKGAYAFFVLVFIHVSLMLAPAALHGGKAAQASILVYVTTLAVYVAMRSAKAVRGKKTQGASHDEEEGFAQEPAASS